MNKKYKHVVTGKVVEQTDSKYHYVNNHELIPNWVVEDSNDWVEIKEFPKITILKNIYSDFLLYYDGEKCIKRTDGMSLEHTISLTAALENGCIIYQVQTETDTFTVGDRVKHPFDDSNGNIDKFIICKNIKRDVVAVLGDKENIGKIFACVDNAVANIEVSKLEKAKEPLKDWEWYVEEYFKSNDTKIKLSNVLSNVSNTYLKTVKEQFLNKNFSTVWEYRIGLLKFICDDLVYSFVSVLIDINSTRRSYKKIYEICPKNFLESIL